MVCEMPYTRRLSGNRAQIPPIGFWADCFLWCISRCSGGAGVLQGDDESFIALLVVNVDDEQPSPGSEHEAKRAPAALQRVADSWESLERTQRARDSRASVGWQAVREDQPVEVLDRYGAERGARHRVRRLELVQADGLAGETALEPELGALVCA